MKRIAVTGGTGLVGSFLVRELLRHGHEVVLLGRREPADLFHGLRFRRFDLSGRAPSLKGFDAVVHAAFSHVPGRYRGGEGDDPAGFIAANRNGSLDLLDAAERDGVGCVAFLSSRAVYGTTPPGTVLREDRVAEPDTLYGKVKLEVERAMEGRGFRGLALRATGVYGAPAGGQAHKWEALFEDFAAGRPVAPRAGTEVHGEDLAAALHLLLGGTEAGVFNVSDFVLDRHDLLAAYARLAGITRQPPPRADAAAVSAMDTTRLRALGWRPGGPARLEPSLRRMLHLRNGGKA